MANLPSSFYWYDYETFGTHPAYDRPVQFAGLRTDLELNPIGKPLVIYNRLSDDYLPDPDACKITGLSPQTVNQKGLSERDFISAIVTELSQPGTCQIGYNSIRFDDEFTRHTLFRNFHDPYSHEWRNGNSRWDLLNVVRLTRALRPDGIQWPIDDEGRASNRLEHLTQANGLNHENAHDALSDVEATIAVARLIKQKQPRLFEYALTHYNKQAAAELLDLRNIEMRVHVSGMIPRERSHLALVAAIAQHPLNRNSIIAFDLFHDPEELLALASVPVTGSVEIAKRLFTKNEDLPAGVTRLPLKNIQLNKAPTLAPVSVIGTEETKRLSLDLEQHERHLTKLRSMTDAQRQEIQQAYNQAAKSENEDVEGSLYSGTFASNGDARLLEKIRRSDARELNEMFAAGSADKLFDDNRYAALLSRYKARNFPESLDKTERTEWITHCKRAINRNMSFEVFQKKLQDEDWNSESLIDLKEQLQDYANGLYKRLHA